MEIKEPIGKFIIENATPVQGNDGAYFHYSDVCKLLKLQQKNMITEEELKNYCLKAILCMGGNWDSSNLIQKFNDCFKHITKK